MSAWGEVETFTGYLGDSAASILGIQTNFASQLEISTGDVGPAGNQDASPDANAAAQAAQLSDIQGSEKQILDAQNAQLGLPPGGLLGAIPTWAWWVAGGVAGIAVLAMLAPYVGLLPKRGGS